MQLIVEADRRECRHVGDLGRVGQRRRQAEAGGDCGLVFDRFDRAGFGGVDVRRSGGQVAVGVRRRRQLGNLRHGGLVGRAVAPGCFLAVLGDQPAVDQTMLRGHLAGRVTGCSGRHAVHLDDGDTVTSLLQQERCRQSADTGADHDDIDGGVTR